MKKIYRSPSLQFLSRLLFALHGLCCDLFEDEIFSERFKLLEDRVFELYNIPEDLVQIDEEAVVLVGTEEEASAYCDTIWKVENEKNLSIDDVINLMNAKAQGQEVVL